MATRGARPKPAALRVVTATHRADRHGEREEAQSSVEASKQSFGALVRPSFLTGQARKAWERYIEPAFWLDASKEPAAIAFCELWKEFRSRPEDFQAAKHGQMRSYMSELGLTDERNRAKKDEDGKKDPSARYLG